MSERLCGLFRTIVVFAPLMLSLAGMLFFPYQMKASVSRLEAWWAQEKKGDVALSIVWIPRICKRIWDGKCSASKIYAAWCFQPVKIESRWIYKSTAESTTVGEEEWVSFDKKLQNPGMDHLALEGESPQIVTFDF